jgi:DNA (cytosine-5)-methyltransferase 1
MSPLVLSVFPGLGLFDYAFEQEGFCVVRGPDLLWGGDIRSFHPPPVFAGVIGGPPCQSFSPIGNVNRMRYGDDSVMGDMVPQFQRMLDETEPKWWVMENSIYAYAPREDAHEITLDTVWLGERQNRRRRFWSNLNLQAHLPSLPALVGIDAGSERAVSWKDSVDWRGSRKREKARSVADMLELQGFWPDMLKDCPMTVSGAKKAVGNGVPLAMGVTIAKAIISALKKL